MQAKFDLILETASHFLLDKQTEIKNSLVCLLAKGHLLIEDQPGVGKTTMVQIISKLCGLQTNRVQFTSDLLPADILGNMIWSENIQEFNFHRGPIFTQLLLADELNRASPRTQSALLQAMEESHISVDGKSIKLPEPFFVIATQNPQSQVGTYPLPESQLDRFLMSLELKHASPEAEKKLFKGFDPRSELDQIQAVISAQDFMTAQNSVNEVHVSDVVVDYILKLIETGREAFPEHPISTRAGMALTRAAKAHAYLEKRTSLRPENVQAVASSVLGHRIAPALGIRKGRYHVESLLQKVAVPV